MEVEIRIQISQASISNPQQLMMFKCQQCENLLTLQNSKKCKKCQISFCKYCIINNECPKCHGTELDNLHRIVQNQLVNLEIACLCGCDKKYSYKDYELHNKRKQQEDALVQGGLPIEKCLFCLDQLQKDIQSHLKNECRIGNNFICSQQCLNKFKLKEQQKLSYGECYVCLQKLQDIDVGRTLQSIDYLVNSCPLSNTVDVILQIQKLKLKIQDQKKEQIMTCNICEQQISNKEGIQACKICEEQLMCSQCLTKCNICENTVCRLCASKCRKCDKIVLCIDCTRNKNRCKNCNLTFCPDCLQDNDYCPLICSYLYSDSTTCEGCLKIVTGKIERVKCNICEQSVLKECSFVCMTCKKLNCIHSCVSIKMKKKCKFC